MTQRWRQWSSAPITTAPRWTSPMFKLATARLRLLRLWGTLVFCWMGLSMRQHVNSLCSRAHLYLCNISKICHLLTGGQQWSLFMLMSPQVWTTAMHCYSAFLRHSCPGCNGCTMRLLAWCPSSVNVTTSPWFYMDCTGCWSDRGWPSRCCCSLTRQYLADLLSWYWPTWSLQSLVTHCYWQCYTVDCRPLETDPLPVQQDNCGIPLPGAIHASTTLSTFRKNLKTFLLV